MLGDPVLSPEDFGSSDSDNASTIAVVGEGCASAVAVAVPDNGFSVSTADEKNAFNSLDNSLKRAARRLGSAVTPADVVKFYNQCSYFEIRMKLDSARTTISETDDVAHEILRSNQDWKQEQERWTLENPTSRYLHPLKKF